MKGKKGKHKHKAPSSARRPEYRSRPTAKAPPQPMHAAVSRFGEGFPKRHVTYWRPGSPCLLTLECGHQVEVERLYRWMYCHQCPRAGAGQGAAD